MTFSGSLGPPFESDGADLGLVLVVPDAIASMTASLSGLFKGTSNPSLTVFASAGEHLAQPARKKLITHRGWCVVFQERMP
jgi:hypothetical protein